VKIGGMPLNLPLSKAGKVKNHIGKKVWLGIRLEYISIGNIEFNEEGYYV